MSLPAVNSPVKRETPLTSPFSVKFYPVSVVTPGTLPGTPIVAGSIQNGVLAYSIQTPLASPLAIAANFPAT